MNQCQIHRKYAGEVFCNNVALDHDPERVCILHSTNVGKDPDNFIDAIKARLAQDNQEYDLRGVFFPRTFNLSSFFESGELKKPINFSRAIFVNQAIFSGLKFINAIFHNAVFAEAYFQDAIFSKKAIFNLAQFKSANFSQANFLDAAYFMDSIFTESANFQRAQFIWAFFSDSILKQADFSHAKFEKLAAFHNVKFKQKADFSGVNLSGRMFFTSLNRSGNLFESDFTNLWLDGPYGQSSIRFKDLSLSHVRFAGTDLRHVEFNHVKWYSFGGRMAVYDEVLLRQEEKKNPWFWTWFCHYAPYAELPAPWGDKYGEVERLYRYLKINYETENDYKNAGDFHYGEMEMHRRASKWRWFPFYWYNLYRFLSGYGERPSWALGWLAVFLVGIAGLVCWLGLEVGNPPHIANFGDSFIYLLQKATLQRPTLAEPVGFCGKLIAGLSVMLIPGQTALFLLALRNRLGRRR